MENVNINARDDNFGMHSIDILVFSYLASSHWLSLLESLNQSFLESVNPRFCSAFKLSN